MLEKLFHLKKNGTDVRTEILAGITVFLTMAYILAVNPEILGKAGMDEGAVFTATALSAVVATLVMAFGANLPYGLAPGMGLNAFFAYTVCIGMDLPWEFALTAVFLEGILFIILTFFNVREMIINAIPENIKHAMSVGIGLFIAFIGLQHAELIVGNSATLVELGSLKSPKVIVACIGVIVTAVFLTMKMRGALLVGIITATIVGIPLEVTPIKELDFSIPSIEPIAFKFDWEWIKSVKGIFSMFTVLFTFLFVDMFDTVGTLIGVSTKANMLDEDGKIPNVKRALFADAIGTTVGACLGTSTVTTFVESAAGVAEGGRTGLTSLTVAILFLGSLFLSPIFLMIPSAATAPALIIVGAMMLTPILKIDLDDYTELIPAFLTLIIMPLTYSIADGVVFGILSYVILKALIGRFKDLSFIMVLLAVLFVLKFIFA